MPTAKEIRMTVRLAAAGWVLLLAPAIAKPAELQLGKDTLAAWDEYLRSAGSHLEGRLSGKIPFLWMEEAPERWRRVHDGEILVSPMVGGGRRSVPGGIIHHWIGAVFIPDTQLEHVLAVLHDYDHYQDFFKPTVIASKHLAQSDNQRKFGMCWRKKVLFQTSVIETEYDSRDINLDQKRWYGLAWSTRIQEIRDYGGSNARKLPPDSGNGYIWRVYSISRYEERDGGVYAEVESFVLSRDIPAGLRWLVDPVVARLSRNALLTSLEQTRQAVRKRTGNVNWCRHGASDTNIAPPTRKRGPNTAAP